MSELSGRADLRDVTSSTGGTDRGAEIRRRFEALGISDRKWHTTTGIDRKTLNRAMDNASNATTYRAIESWLDELEAADQGKPTTIKPLGDPEDDLVEFTIEGNFGVRAVVKGPVRDIDALQAAVQKLVAGMSSESDEKKP